MYVTGYVGQKQQIMSNLGVSFTTTHKTNSLKTTFDSSRQSKLRENRGFGLWETLWG